MWRKHESGYFGHCQADYHQQGDIYAGIYPHFGGSNLHSRLWCYCRTVRTMRGYWVSGARTSYCLTTLTIITQIHGPDCVRFAIHMHETQRLREYHCLDSS